MSILTNDLLQQRVNELNSAIFKIMDGKVHLTGFYNEKRLKTHLDKGMDNWMSKGLYDFSDVTFKNIRNNALFLIMKDDEIIEKHKYSVYKQDTVERKSKSGPLILTIRKHEFLDEWQITVLKKTYSFTTKSEMIDYMNENFKFDFEI